MELLSLMGRVIYEAVLEAGEGLSLMGRVIYEAVLEAGEGLQDSKLALAPVGRNDPCPCGSGKKSKKCCGAGGGWN